MPSNRAKILDEVIPQLIDAGEKFTDAEMDELNKITNALQAYRQASESPEEMGKGFRMVADSISNQKLWRKWMAMFITLSMHRHPQLIDLLDEHPELKKVFGNANKR